MNHLTIIQQIIVWALPILFAVTVHEVSHGWMASKLGDKTAQMLGRLTLNPLKHIDMIGTIIVPLTLLLFGGGKFIFGWAKPVPIMAQNLRHPKRDLALISIVGPLSNFLMAIIWAAIMKLGVWLIQTGIQAAFPLILMGEAGIMINLVLCVLNLLPIPPLDGGHFVAALLPNRIAYYYTRFEHYGFVIVFILIVTGILNLLLAPPVVLLHRLLMTIFRL